MTAAFVSQSIRQHQPHRKSAKSRAKIRARRHARKKGNMTHKNVAAAAGLEKKTIDLQQVHEASFTSFREKTFIDLRRVTASFAVSVPYSVLGYNEQYFNAPPSPPSQDSSPPNCNPHPHGILTQSMGFRALIRKRRGNVFAFQDSQLDLDEKKILHILKGPQLDPHTSS